MQQVFSIVCRFSTKVSEIRKWTSIGLLCNLSLAFSKRIRFIYQSCFLEHRDISIRKNWIKVSLKKCVRISIGSLKSILFNIKLWRSFFNIFLLNKLDCIVVENRDNEVFASFELCDETRRNSHRRRRTEHFIYKCKFLSKEPFYNINFFDLSNA